MKEFVRGVRSRLLRIGIAQQFVVPVCVQTENVPPTRVYNLTLANHNAYYANGFLVWNCADALSFTFAYPVGDVFEDMDVDPSTYEDS